MKKVIITLVVALTFAATASADLIKLQLPEVTSQQIQEENAFIQGEGLKAWKAENEARIAEQGKIDDMYFEILIAATRFNRVFEETYIPSEFQGSRYSPRYPKHKTRFTMGFRYIPWDVSKKAHVIKIKRGIFSERYDSLIVKVETEIHIVRVTKGSPAEKAGLKAWDRIVSINGETSWKSAKDFEKLLEKSTSKANFKKHKGAIILGIERDKSIRSIQIKMIEILDFNLIQLESPKVAAFADGKNVYITRGMVEFAKNDDEIKFTLAHELSHNIMRHSKTKKLGAILGGFFGAALDIGLGHINKGYIYTDFTKLFSEIGKVVHSKKHEREADYLGMYIVAAAGGDVSNVLNLWRRIAIEELRTTGTLSEGATHPSDPERSLLMLATFKEIQEKRKKEMKVFPSLEK